MRDYLYIWHDLETQAIVACGLEFKDLMISLNTQGGVLLIDHQSTCQGYDAESRFNFVARSDLPILASENIYSWGNFVWADYASPTFPAISNGDIAELLFFAHKAIPLRTIAIPQLGNKFLCYEHDDGWYMRLYYTDWKYVEDLIVSAIPSNIGTLNASELREGGYGYWLQGGERCQEEKTHDVDRILNRRLVKNAVSLNKVKVRKKS